MTCSSAGARCSACSYATRRAPSACSEKSVPATTMYGFVDIIDLVRSSLHRACQSDCSTCAADFREWSVVVVAASANGLRGGASAASATKQGHPGADRLPSWAGGIELGLF